MVTEREPPPRTVMRECGRSFPSGVFIAGALGQNFLVDHSLPPASPLMDLPGLLASCHCASISKSISSPRTSGVGLQIISIKSEINSGSSWLFERRARVEGLLLLSTLQFASTEVSAKAIWQVIYILTYQHPHYFLPHFCSSDETLRKELFHPKSIFAHCQQIFDDPKIMTATAGVKIWQNSRPTVPSRFMASCLLE
jgi:hypothetical protein